MVDRNNDLVTEEYRLSREVARILRELASRLSPFAGDFSTPSTARFSRLRRSRGPMGKRESLRLRRGASGRHWFGGRRSRHPPEAGRHPLLRPRAVPIDLVLSPGSRMLIVTGPNTGGKTVTLKTAALFALLNQSGWPLPAGLLFCLYSTTSDATSATNSPWTSLCRLFPAT